MTKPNQNHSDYANLNKSKPNLTKPNQLWPNQTKLNDIKPDSTIPNQTNIQVFLAFYLNLKFLKSMLVLRNSCTDLYLFFIELDPKFLKVLCRIITFGSTLQDKLEYSHWRSLCYEILYSQFSFVRNCQVIMVITPTETRTASVPPALRVSEAVKLCLLPTI